MRGKKEEKRRGGRQLGKLGEEDGGEGKEAPDKYAVQY